MRSDATTFQCRRPIFKNGSLLEILVLIDQGNYCELNCIPKFGNRRIRREREGGGGGEGRRKRDRQNKNIILQN